MTLGKGRRAWTALSKIFPTRKIVVESFRSGDIPSQTTWPAIACRVTIHDYIADCLYFRTFEQNVVLACALLAYAIPRKLQMCDAYDLYRVRRLP